MAFKLFENFEIRDFLLFLSAILTIYVAQYYYKYFTRVNPLPGPFPFPFVGNLPQYYLWFNGENKKFYEYNYKKYGDICEVQFNERAIVLSRTEYIEKLLTPSTKNSHVVRFPDNEGLEELGIEGKGILLNQDLKSWKYNRQFFSQAILSPKFTNEAIDWTNKLFNELEGYWNKLFLKEKIIKENQDKLDFAAWLHHYTNDMIIKLLTGERSYSMAAYFDTLSDEKSDHPLAIVDDSVKLVQALRKHLLGFIMFVNVSSFLRHYVPFFKNKADDLLQNVRFINNRLDEIIKRRRQTIENTPLNEPLTNDMLTSLITANTSRDVNHTKTVGGEALNRPMTDTEIRGIIFDGFLGGTDTTANTISFVTYYLAHNQDVKKKLIEEIDRIFQGDETRPITENDFQKLKYCEAIVKEVSRVLTIAPVFTRYINKPDEIAGYKWPAGTVFRINADAIHYNKDYWEDPDKFNPDRWMAEGFESKKLSFLMFGGGLRLCPGRKLAMIELVCLIALFYRKYEIDLVDMNAPLKVINGGVTACGELLTKIKHRK
ncbi:cytochrome P450 [Rhizophagus irregularis]|uniref:Cytochrome P450 n=2 Tax=Rhizophagus irregularis TaxID=588596 RepID=A0A2N0RQR3_9GLOM|nr:cytochrome P450 [Rhizophagus irregularis]